ncbi:MAG TPA: DUF5985 family protein [Gemmatimonas sp.]|nr:DUF5985 family protein [Gemmatimonas sp.]
MTLVIYLLCFATSVWCAWLLLRAFRRTRSRLLFWSGLCFCCMAVNNLVLILDERVFPTHDLMAARLLPALAGVGLLLFGLVWETKQ